MPIRNLILTHIRKLYESKSLEDIISHQTIDVLRFFRYEQ